jgi:hypothetical protein
MCKPPDLDEYLSMSEQQRAEANWEFMGEVRSCLKSVRDTLRWHAWAGMAFVGVLSMVSGTGIGLMNHVGDARDERLAAIEAKVEAKSGETEKVLDALRLLQATDSVCHQEIMRRLDRLDRR